VQPYDPKLPILFGFICSIFSLIGALFTIAVYLLIPSTRKNFFFFLAFHLAISDLCISITGLTLSVPEDLPKNICTAFATVRGFAFTSSCIINLVIALFIYKRIQTDSFSQGHAKQKMTFFYTNYLFSLFGSIGPLVSGAYGPSSIYCWIDIDSNTYLATFWMICEAYIATPIFLIWVILLYVWIIRQLKGMVHWERRRDVNKLAVVPLLFVIANVITLIDIFNDSLFGHHMTIKIIHICFRQMQGFFHALIYAFGIVRDEIFNKIKERKSHSETIYNNDEYSSDANL